MKRRKQVLDTIRCLVDGSQWGEYLRAGESYTVQYPPRPRERFTMKHDVYFRHASGSGTMMRFYSFLRAIEAGQIEIVCPANNA